MKIKVFIADAQPLFSECLAVALGLNHDLEIVKERSTFGTDAVYAIRRHQPDVVLLDFWLPGVDGPKAGVEAVGHLEGFKVIFLSWFISNKPWFDPASDIEAVIAAGAVGFLPKHARLDHVVEAICCAHRGDVPVLADALHELVARMRDERQHASEFLQELARLTPREIEILELMAQGIPIAEAAARLYISPATFRTHVKRILQKTGTHSQMAAVATARNFGIILQ